MESKFKVGDEVYIINNSQPELLKMIIVDADDEKKYGCIDDYLKECFPEIYKKRRQQMKKKDEIADNNVLLNLLKAKGYKNIQSEVLIEKPIESLEDLQTILGQVANPLNFKEVKKNESDKE